LAGGDANLVILDGDWGKSAATDETDKRLDFLALLESVEAGEVSTVYAYSTDRLARSVRWAVQFLDACEKAGTTIVTSEGRFAPHDDMARTMFQFQAMQNEGYSRQAKRKRASSIESQRARGVKLGAPYYGALPDEDLAAVITAYNRIGSLVGTARELNRLGVKSRRGHWAHSSVQRILAREGLVPEHGVRGAAHRQPYIFARLLRCHCGHLLTGNVRPWGVAYRCLLGEEDVDHPKKSISEGIILRWAEVEIGRLTPPSEPVALTDLVAERHALTARTDRLRVAFLAGLVTEPDMLEEKADIDSALTQLDLAGQAVQIPPFSWDHEPRDVNLALRALWAEVQLDEHLFPVRASWLVPETWLAPAAPR
jgi:DNA invertase Pin-like site-specific DNA recombinase